MRRSDEGLLAKRKAPEGVMKVRLRNRETDERLMNEVSPLKMKVNKGQADLHAEKRANPRRSNEGLSVVKRRS